jgi:hypothetical protein
LRDRPALPEVSFNRKERKGRKERTYVVFLVKSFFAFFAFFAVNPSFARHGRPEDRCYYNAAWRLAMSITFCRNQTYAPQRGALCPAQGAARGYTQS